MPRRKPCTTSGTKSEPPAAGSPKPINADRYGPIVWDAYLLFGPNSRWDNEPSALLASGSPVIGATDSLQRELRPYLEAR